MSELLEMHTGSVLERLKLLRGLQECFEKSDWSAEERDLVAAAGKIAFKNTDIWKAAWAETKDVLLTREHLKRGSKAKRKAAAFSKQHR